MKERDNSQQRVTDILRVAAAKFVLHEANSNPLITITRADVSPDSKNVFIFFTTIPVDKEADAEIFLKRNAGEFRHFLKQNTRLKRIPHIEFHVDAGERHRQHMDDLVKELDED